MENLSLTFPINELASAISDKVKKDIEIYLNSLNTQKKEEELLTRKQAASLLGISLPTLNEWTKNAIIPAHRISSRIRYKKSEVEKSLTQIRTLNKGR